MRERAREILSTARLLRIVPEIGNREWARVRERDGGGRRGGEREREREREMGLAAKERAWPDLRGMDGWREREGESERVGAVSERAHVQGQVSRAHTHIYTATKVHPFSYTLTHRKRQEDGLILSERPEGAVAVSKHQNVRLLCLEHFVCKSALSHTHTNTKVCIVCEMCIACLCMFLSVYSFRFTFVL